jgi:hypothetical protein
MMILHYVFIEVLTKRNFGGCFEQVRLVAKGNGSYVKFKYNVFEGGFLLHTPHQF